MSTPNGSPQQQTLKPTPKPSRMALGAVTKGKIDAPLRVLLYGVEGVGKSTFGAGAPSPIFLGAEEGTTHLDVARFPKPETYAEVFEALTELAKEKHEYQTLVIDTLDWLEPLIWRELCRREQVASIEEVGGGFQKGYVAAVDEWRRLLAALERLQVLRRIHVVMLAHSYVKTFKDPESEGYDRYQLKLHEKAAGVCREWSDAVLFTKHETITTKDKKTKRVRGVETGARLIFTTQRAAFDAKNRYSLPDVLPLSWPDFYEAVQAGRVAEPAVLKGEIARKAAELGGDLQKVILETMAKAGDNAQQLVLVNNRVNAKLAEKAASETTAEAEKEVAS